MFSNLARTKEEKLSNFSSVTKEGPEEMGSRAGNDENLRERGKNVRDFAIRSIFEKIYRSTNQLQESDVLFHCQNPIFQAKLLTKNYLNFISKELS
jgi:hypothetical protein